MYLNTIPTTSSVPEEQKFPERFLALPVTQQHGAQAALLPLPQAVQQQVLQEWDRRCRQQSVRKPAAYLFGIIQKAYQGEFNAWAADSGALPAAAGASATPPVIPTVPEPPTPADRARVQEHLQNIRTLVGRWKPRK